MAGMILAGTAFCAEPPALSLFSTTSVRLRPPEAAKTDFQLTLSRSNGKPVEATAQRYRSMNGEGPLMWKSEPRGVKTPGFLTTAPGGGILSENPNKPPGRFTK